MKKILRVRSVLLQPFGQEATITLTETEEILRTHVKGNLLHIYTIRDADDD